MKNGLLTLAGALTLLAVLGQFYAVPAIAQVRAALVKNIAEKGRIPYMQTLFVSCAAGAGPCNLAFPAVPAGKRLVVEHVNAHIDAANGINGTFLSAGGSTISFVLPGRISSDSAFIAVNEPVLVYFESGQSPVFQVAPRSLSDRVMCTVVISGYLVDLTQ